MELARTVVTSLARRIHKKQILEARQITKQQRRQLNVHEHVAYTLLSEAGIPTPPFKVAKTSSEAAEHAKSLDTRDIVLKAQVLTGGRGVGNFKGTDIGGVVVCDTPEQARINAEKMLGKLLVTKQTGLDGKICNSVMITTRMFPRKEFYLSIMMERSFGGPVVIISTEGGVNIEDTAATRPDAISYFPIDIDRGICPDDAKKIAEKLSLDEKGEATVAQMITNMYELFIKKDALLLEINPLVEDICGDYYALDCKCNFDDDAEFRQKALFDLRDWSQLNPNESQAEKFNLNYIQLDGNIACMVNGAGLAMATMDIIKLSGGEPANFLDVGGGASAETVKEAFKIITSDSKVDAIFVNIFGGIMRCDVIAEGIIKATKDLDLKIPVVVRLQGTNVNEARKLIQEAQLKIIPIDDMTHAAEASVKIAKMVQLAKSMNLDINLTMKKDTSDSDKPGSKYSAKC